MATAISRVFPPLAMLVIAAGLTACGDGLPEADVIELNERFDADFALIDHNGDPATDERFEGKPMFIYYGFTACPDVCPAALGNMTATLDRLGKKAEDIQPLFITVDPGRDDAQRLKDHLAYDGRILGLTGSEKDLATARKAMNVYAAIQPLPDSAMEYTVDHQRLFYVTDREGRPAFAIKDTVPPEQMAKLIRNLL